MAKSQRQLLEVQLETANASLFLKQAKMIRAFGAWRKQLAAVKRIEARIRKVIQEYRERRDQLRRQKDQGTDNPSTVAAPMDSAEILARFAAGQPILVQEVIK